MRVHDKPAARQTRKESQQETRQRLVASAIVLFARSGVISTSLNAVAEHAGFTRGAVHSNYSSKDELAAAVAETVAAELAPQLRQILTAPAPSSERLGAYIRSFLDYCAKNPGAASALIAVVEYFSRANPQHYGDRATASLGDLIDLFDDGQRRGEMRDFDTRTMAFSLRTVLDNAAAHLCVNEAEVGGLATEIVALFAAATRAGDTA